MIVLESPFNYTGSKSKLINKLRPLFPSNKTKCYDLFCGGGGFFSNVINDFDIVVANDIVDPLIGFYKWLQTTEWNEVLETVCNANIDKSSQKEYLDLRDRFNTDRNPIDFFILACSCTNNMVRFNRNMGFNQTWGKRNFNINTKMRLKNFHQAIFNNQKISFSNQQFNQVEIDDGSFVYLDPPYLLTGGGYNTNWSEAKDEELCNFLDLLDSRGIKFMMSNVMLHNGVENPNMHRFRKYNLVTFPEVDYQKVSRRASSTTEEFIAKNY